MRLCPLRGLGRNPKRVRFVPSFPFYTRLEIFQRFVLVHHREGWDLVGIDLFKNRIRRFDVFLYTHIRRINDVQQ
ncbi:hypothetical protein HmCmsJML021_01089 [Escherichia coli]|nr:hypothetical protein HmCmsJML021_01089 [Escherichia coli]